MTVLYLHGFDGSPNQEKIEILERELGAKVIAPQLSNRPLKMDQNLAIANKLASENNVDLIFGTSLGGFTALAVDSVNCAKVVHNPCMEPSEILPALDAKITPETIAFLKDMEKKIPVVDDINSARGIFSEDDELFSYMKEWNDIYSHRGISIPGAHRISAEELEKYVVPVMKKAVDADAETQAGIFGISEQKRRVFESVLREQYHNVFKPQEMQRWAPEVWRIMEISYSKIGGLKGVNTPEDLIQESWFWKIQSQNEKVLAVMCYKQSAQGRKMFCCGSDGSPEGKKRLNRMLSEDIGMNLFTGDKTNITAYSDKQKLILQKRNAFMEVSDALEHILIKYVGATPVPNTQVHDILKKKIENLDPDGIHYTREIGGEMHTKVMVGNLAPLQAAV